jgi:hypothetical protein
MPRCEADVCTDEPGAEPVSCLYAGRLDPESGLKLCGSHKALGLVNEAEALQLLEPVLLGSSRTQQLVADLLAGCPGSVLSLHNNLGAKLLLSDTDRAAVAAACKVELARRRTEEQSGDLTKGFELQNGGLHASALELLTPSAELTAEHGAARRVIKLQNLKQLRPAQRPDSRDGKLTTFPGDLEPHSAAAEKVVQQWRRSTLQSCTNAHADTEKNVYTEAVDLPKNLNGQ